MNIVLLSGGSGKRLWPLSNEVRSKQFLKVLRAPDGHHESMIQRVYRQIHEAGISSPIVISTTDNQQSVIRRQLGDDIPIALEPDRRDTFPAVALAAMYLKSEMKADPDETMLVMPIDPYAENSYFQLLDKMDRAVQDDTADLVLMGVKPTYPSAKYGYIIPTSEPINGDVLPVHHFVEKPDENKASILIARGALWNGGVFAFRLRWILAKIQQYTKADNYMDLRAQYDQLKKISFDYEIVEHCGSIAMVPYNGEWKDLGTWNTLSEVMEEPYAGNVIHGEGMSNTHIINELDIPVVALGIHDAVIAATPDGIIVTNKPSSVRLKQYVDAIDQRPMVERRPWGQYKVLNYMAHSDGNRSLTKHLWVEAGKNLSYQRHQNRDEIWTIVDGTADFLLDGHIRNVRRGDVAYITRGQWHSIRAITDLHMIEVQIGPELSEDDIERNPDAWG